MQEKTKLTFCLQSWPPFKIQNPIGLQKRVMAQSRLQCCLPQQIQLLLRLKLVFVARKLYSRRIMIPY